MAPEYGATVGLFPVDEETLAYMRQTGRKPAVVERVKAYMEAQGMLYSEDAPDPVFSETLSLDMNTVEPSLAGTDTAPGPRASHWHEGRFHRSTHRALSAARMSKRTVASRELEGWQRRHA